MQHLIAVSEQISALRAMHRHLEPGGRLVFDVFNPQMDYLVQDRSHEREDTAEVALPDGRAFRRTSRVAAVHVADQYNEIELIYYVRGTDGKTSATGAGLPDAMVLALRGRAPSRALQLPCEGNIR
jgi:hypothetical protein